MSYVDSYIRSIYQDFDLEIKEGKPIFRLEVLISLLGPYMTTHFFKYYLEGNEKKLEGKTTPFIDEHNIYCEKIKLFAQTNNLTILDEERSFLVGSLKLFF